MPLDPTWIAVIGTAGGAAIGTVGGTLVEWAKVATQGKQQRLADAERRKDEAAEAKVVREADAADKETHRRHEAAQREDAQRTALRDERAAKIRQWREGLEKSHREYLEWSAKHEVESRRAEHARSPLPRPNIAGAVWFQSLRPYFSVNFDDDLRRGDDIECNDDDAQRLGEAITDVEREWRLDD